MLSKKHNSSFLFFLAGGFNPFEKYQSNWIISPNRDEHKTYLKPPPSFFLFKFFAGSQGTSLAYTSSPRESLLETLCTFLSSKRPKVAVVLSRWRLRTEIMDGSNKTLLLFTTLTVFPFHLQATPCWNLLEWK